MKRRITRATVDHKIDIFGKYWHFAFGTIPTGMLQLWDGKEFREVSGQCGIFFPRFSLSQWVVAKGSIDFEGYFSARSLCSSEPDHVLVFRDLKRFPDSVEDVVDLMSHSADAISLDVDSAVSPLARKCRRKIADSFTDGVSIETLALSLHVPHSTLTRAFQKAYGLTPIQYRNSLRIHEATFLLLTDPDRSISTVSHDVGFNDLSRFNKQFKKFTESTPREYRWN